MYRSNEESQCNSNPSQLHQTIKPTSIYEKSYNISGSEDISSQVSESILKKYHEEEEEQELLDMFSQNLTLESREMSHQKPPRDSSVSLSPISAQEKRIVEFYNIPSTLESYELDFMLRPYIHMGYRLKSRKFLKNQSKLVMILKSSEDGTFFHYIYREGGR